MHIFSPIFGAKTTISIAVDVKCLFAIWERWLKSVSRRQNIMFDLT